MKNSYKTNEYCCKPACDKRLEICDYLNQKYR